jgi:hypothetical protein
MPVQWAADGARCPDPSAAPANRAAQSPPAWSALVSNATLPVHWEPPSATSIPLRLLCLDASYRVCGRPSLTDKVQGAWAVQTVNGQPASESLRGRVAVAFRADDTCQRGGDVGTFRVIGDAVIRTRIGDRKEVIAVEVSGGTLTMQTAEGVVTVLGRGSTGR